MTSQNHLQTLDYPKLLKILSGLRETKPNALIFLCGIHGSGKTSLAKKLENDLLGLKLCSAGKLVNHLGRTKHVENVASNQSQILDAFKCIRNENDLTLLDGHCCLLNKKDEIEFVGLEIFQRLSPDVVLLIEDTVENIHKRLYLRDGVFYQINKISRLLQEERNKAYEVASELNIPMYRIVVKNEN